MSYIPVPKYNERECKAHLNDYETLATLREGIFALVSAFVHEQQYAPTILNIGIQNGLIAEFCLEAGASHVTLLETDPDALSKAKAYLSKRPFSNYAFLEKSSLQLPKDVQYDILVVDMFGSTINAKGVAAYAWDLCRRGVIRKFENKQQRYVFPSEGTMTIRAYYAPAISVDQEHFLVQMREPQPSKIKWRESSDLEHFVFNESNCIPMSDRVDVVHEFYDEPEQSPINWPSKIHIQIWPSAMSYLKEYPYECIFVLEWSLCLGKHHQLTHSVMKNIHPKLQRARMLSWGYKFTYMASSLSDFSVTYKMAGGIQLGQGDPGDVSEEKNISVKKLCEFADDTFAKITRE